MRPRRGKLIWVLALVAVLLVFLAAASGAVYLVLRQRQDRNTRWHDPLAAITPDGIAPELALYPLAGASDLDAIDAGIDNNALETAFSTLVFSTDLPDAQRIGRLLLLGERFSAAGDPESADLSYRQVYDLAILSPELNDPARADALLASGRGWKADGSEVKALEAYDQVYLIAVRSPYLQISQRRALLSALDTAYGELGDQERAQASRDRVVELDREANARPPASPVQSPDLAIGEEPVSTPELGALEESRRKAAYAVLQALSDGEDPPPDLVTALAEALRAEDAAKLSFYQQELDAATQIGRRVNVHAQVIRWLTIKYQVARKGFGLSLIPEWEEAEADVQSALAKAHEGLFFDQEDLMTGLPDASLVAPGSYRSRRGAILAGRLGQYPNFPGEQLAGKLQDAVMDMIAAGFVEPLYVDAEVGRDSVRFFLSPADDYGRTGEEAP